MLEDDENIYDEKDCLSTKFVHSPDLLGFVWFLKGPKLQFWRMCVAEVLLCVEFVIVTKVKSKSGTFLFKCSFGNETYWCLCAVSQQYQGYIFTILLGFMQHHRCQTPEISNLKELNPLLYCVRCGALMVKKHIDYFQCIGLGVLRTSLPCLLRPVGPHGWCTEGHNRCTVSLPWILLSHDHNACYIHVVVYCSVCVCVQVCVCFHPSRGSYLCGSYLCGEPV